MKTGGGGRIITLFFVLATLLSVYRLSAQGNNSTLQCGTPDIPIEKFNELRAKYITGANKPDASAVAIPVVPVWIYIVRNSNGETNMTSESAQAAVLGINQYFTGLFTFTVCGTTIMDSDTYSDLALPEFVGLGNLVNAASQPLDDNCVKVFFTQIIHAGAFSGYTWPPGIDGYDFNHSGLAVVNNNIKTLAHEMGHYFGLPHTHRGTAGDQFVSNDPAVCYTTGDGFCDTPADPGVEDTPCGAGAACIVDCDGFLDPVGVPYAPDPTLLMSYYIEECKNRFSGEQKIHMRAVYNGYPDYVPLHSPNSVCVPPVIPLIGKVYVNCANNQSNTITPLVDLPIAITYPGLNSCNVETDISGSYPTPFSPVFNCIAPVANYTVVPPKAKQNATDPAYLDMYNGVNVYDLILISRHILGLEPLSSPSQFIAADANNSGTVTSTDKVSIQQGILYDVPTLPAGSWRYVPDFWAISNPIGFAVQFNDDNPFDAVAPPDPITGIVRKYKSATNDQVNTDSWMDHITLHTGQQSGMTANGWNMTAVKVGDINCDFNLEPFSPNDDNVFTFLSDAGFNTALTANSTKNISIVATSPAKIAAWQIALSYPMDKMGIQQAINGDAGLSLTVDNFSKIEDAAQNKGVFRSLWYSEDGTPVTLNEKRLFTLNVNTNAPISKIGDILQLDPTALGIKFFDTNGNEVHNVTLKLKVELPGFGLGGDTNDRSVNLENNQLFSVNVSPVPFTSELHFTVNAPEKEVAVIALFDITGREVVKVTYPLSQGRNTLEIPDVEQLPGGVYGYWVKAGAFTQSGKIVK